MGQRQEMSSGIRTSTLRLILEAMGRSITNQFMVTVEGAFHWSLNSDWSGLQQQWFNQLLEVRFSPLTEFLVVLVMVSTVYNLERQPDLCIEQGEKHRVGVVINNGTIVEVNVSRPGHKYGLHRNLSLRMRVKVRPLTDTDHHQHWIFGKSHCC